MNFKKLTAFSILSLVITGCQTVPKAPTIQTPQPSQTSIEHPIDNSSEQPIQQLQKFQITGKIGVRTPQQNGSAFYGWTQEGEHFAIDLTGAMGIGQTAIRGSAGDVTLTSSKTGTLQANTPEELLFKATKWEAPITYLISWINAQPAQANAVITHDELMRPKTIQEGAWQATLSYQDAEKLPNKLILVDDANQNRVTLTIQTRQ